MKEDRISRVPEYNSPLWSKSMCERQIVEAALASLHSEALEKANGKLE